ncbi:MAG: Uma2 family endonuclease [Blastocatellia bacterium]
MSITAEQLAAIMPSATELLSDEPEMETSLHAFQLRLLVNILEWHWRDRDDFFIGDNLTIYFSREQLKTQEFRGPDFFLVKNTERRHRTSWVVWEESKTPDLIIELLSDRTADIDREIKKEIYETRLRTTEYFWFSPQTGEFAGFRLVAGQYREIELDNRGWRWSEALNLYLGPHDRLLRYFTSEGALVSAPDEEAIQAIEEVRLERQRAEQERQFAMQEWQRAEQERQRAEQQQQRAELFATKLRELGVDPNAL